LLIGYGIKLSGFADAKDFVGMQELFGSFALIVLLFDGGMCLNIFDVIFKSARALCVGATITLISMVASAALFMLMGFNALTGAILGAVAGGIGSTTTISIVKSLSLPKQIRNFLTLESSITDIFSIIFAIVLTETLVSGTINFQVIFSGIIGNFAIGLLIGMAAGMGVILLFSKIQKGYNYMMTFATVILLYAVTELLSGSGAIAVLAFGVILGNELPIRKTFKIALADGSMQIKQFQNEISFFIRTFFFVFLGIIVSLGNIQNLAIAVILMAILYVIRYFVICFFTLNTELAEHKKVLAAINPRGLATAVLATYPLIVVENSIAETGNNSLSVLLPQLASLSEISFYLIILSLAFTTILVPLATRKQRKEIPEEKLPVIEETLKKPETIEMLANKQKTGLKK